MTETIKNIEQLQTIGLYSPKNTIHLSFEQLNESENADWEKRINTNFLACGCETGQYFMLVAVVLSVLYSIIDIKWLKGHFTLSLGLYHLLFIVLMSGVGKFVGKQTAYINLKKDINKIKQLLAEREV